jgi:hypothetical protein
MDQLDTKDSATQAMALLGLRAGKSDATAVGDAPTVEDFSALYEGALDATRRAQVLSHIAADQDIYRAWLEVASAQATLDESLAAQPASAQQTVPLLQRLGSWLADMVRMPAVSGSMVAAALVAVMLTPGQDDAPASWGEIDDIYAQYGSDWQVSPSSLRDRSIRSGGSELTASPEQQAIYLGLRGGLDLLGNDFSDKWLPRITVDEGVDSLSPELRDALLATGKLATLARFQCQLEGKQTFFMAAEKSLDNLRPSLDLVESKSSSYLAKVIDQPGEPSDRVCDFSKATVAMLTNKR